MRGFREFSSEVLYLRVVFFQWSRDPLEDCELSLVGLFKKI